MKDPRDIIIAPIVSEKSYALLEQNVYTFVVHPDAAKPESETGHNPPSSVGAMGGARKAARSWAT